MLACAICILLVACADLPPILQGIDGSASAMRLNDPWQPTPMRPAAALLAEADRVCRADMNVPGDVGLLVADARGGGMLQLYYGSPDGRSAECNGIFIRPDGTVQPGGGGSNGLSMPWLPIGVNALEVVSSGGSSGGATVESHRAGRAGTAVSRVLVWVQDLAEPVEASVANGWWAAWWPSNARCLELTALGVDGAELTTLPC